MFCGRWGIELGIQSNSLKKCPETSCGDCALQTSRSKQCKSGVHSEWELCHREASLPSKLDMPFWWVGLMCQMKTRWVQEAKHSGHWSSLKCWFWAVGEREIVSWCLLVILLIWKKWTFQLNHPAKAKKTVWTPPTSPRGTQRALAVVPVWSGLLSGEWSHCFSPSQVQLICPTPQWTHTSVHDHPQFPELCSSQPKTHRCGWGAIKFHT